MDKLIAPDAKFEVLSSGFTSTEGPMWRDGKLWVSEQKKGLIYAIDSDGTKTALVANAGGPIDPAITVNQGPNGEIPYKDGTVLVCRQGLRDIEILHKDGTFTPFLSAYQGKRFNSPNDMVIAPDGALWFTDPPFSVPGGRSLDNPNRQLPWSGVFRYKDGVLTAVLTDNEGPNGIAFSPDGKTLYVSNTGPDMYIRAYTMGSNGELSNPREFFHWQPNPSGYRHGVPDGMKVDVQGNVWATGVGGVNILSADGKLLGRLQGTGHTSNVAFGGPDYKSIFVTGGDSVYRIQTLVQGEIPKYAER